MKNNIYIYCSKLEKLGAHDTHALTFFFTAHLIVQFWLLKNSFFLIKKKNRILFQQSKKKKKKWKKEHERHWFMTLVNYSAMWNLRVLLYIELRGGVRAVIKEKREWLLLLSLSPSSSSSSVWSDEGKLMEYCLKMKVQSDRPFDFEYYFSSCSS